MPAVHNGVSHKTCTYSASSFRMWSRNKFVIYL